jgi:hypothetical protein
MNERLRIFLKALAAYAVLNIVMLAGAGPTPAGPSLYNAFWPGRARLPWGERPDLAYNLSLSNLDAMFASHEIAAPKAADEFRVVLIGDSSTWGFLRRPDETLAAKLNAAGLQRDGRRMRFYNLGYPDFSIEKDALLLQRALRYEPDMVVWLVTLRSFPRDAQSHALTIANPVEACAAVNRACAAPERSLLERTLWGRRREIADLVRLQWFGVAWAASGLDQHYPQTYEPVQRNLEAEVNFREFTPQTGLQRDALAFDAFDAAAGSGVPLLVVNEPIYVSDGANSDVRYNFFYPRWAYDAYREMMRAEMQALGIRYADAWDAVPPSEFTNSAVHRSERGEEMLAEVIERIVR